MMGYPTRGLYIAAKCKQWANEHMPKTRKFPAQTITLKDGEEIDFEEDENSLELYTEENPGVK